MHGFATRCRCGCGEIACEHQGRWVDYVFRESNLAVSFLLGIEDKRQYFRCDFLWQPRDMFKSEPIVVGCSARLSLELTGDCQNPRAWRFQGRGIPRRSGSRGALGGFRCFASLFFGGGAFFCPFLRAFCGNLRAFPVSRRLP